MVIIHHQSNQIKEKINSGAKKKKKKPEAKQYNDPLMARQNIIERSIEGQCRVRLLT